MTKYEVYVNDPALPEGHMVEVPGLGVFPNRGSRQIDKEVADNYRTVSSQLVDVVSDDGPPVWTGAAGTELRRGPTVLSAFKNHPTVSVEKVEEEQPEEAAPKPRARKTEDSKEKKEEPSKES